MSTQDRFSDAERLLRDRNLPVGVRLEAAVNLLTLSRRRATPVLLALAVDEHEEETVARQVGALLGRVYFEGRDLDGAPLHDFSAPAYLGFDDKVAELQRREPD